MTEITEGVQDGDKVVMYKGKIIKVFSKYDDFAFTKGSEYAKRLKAMTKEEFKEIYPEYFL